MYKEVYEELLEENKTVIVMLENIDPQKETINVLELLKKSVYKVEQKRRTGLRAQDKA